MSMCFVTANSQRSFGSNDSKERFTYNVTAEGFGDYKLKGKTFFIAPGDSSVSIKDPEFKEYASSVSTLLQYEGAKEARDFAAADMCVLIVYALADQTYVESIPVPIRGVVSSVSSTYTNSFSNTNTFGSIYGNLYGYSSGYGTSVSGNLYGTTNSLNNTSTTSTTITTPVYGTVGYTSSSQTVTSYIRILNIYAYDNASVDDPDMVWKIRISSAGPSNSLRKVIPYLCFAVTNEGLGGKVSFNFNVDSDWDRTLLFINTIDNLSITKIINKKLTKYISLNQLRYEDECTSLYYLIAQDTSVKIPASIAISAGGKTYELIGVNDGPVRKRFANLKSEPKVLKLSFRSIPEDCTSFSIVNGGSLDVQDISIE